MIAGSLRLIDELRQYRKRLRIMLAWRWGAIGGFWGALMAIAADLLDWFAVMSAPPLALMSLVLGGILMGVGYAMFRPLPPQAIARMIDHRGNLKDRVQSALEWSDKQGTFDEPLLEDALSSLNQMRPRQIFQLRAGFWQGMFVGAFALLLFVHFLPLLPVFNSEERQNERKETQAQANQVQEVAKPIVERAKKPDARELEKRIARNVELYSKRAQQGRMSKKEAMVKYNQILNDAKKLENETRQETQATAQKMETTAEQMLKSQEASKQLQGHEHRMAQRMNDLQKQLQAGKNLDGKPLDSQQMAAMQNDIRNMQATMQAMQNPADQQALQNQMDELRKQMDALQQQLQLGKDQNGSPLSKKMQELLKKQMESLQQQMRALELSKEAQEFLKKLTSDPNFIEAMKKLQELAQKAQQNANEQDPEQKQLTQEEIEAMAKELQEQLEALAKEYGSDEKIKELAEQLRKQVEELKELSACNGACAGLGLGMGAMGTGMSGGAMSRTGMNRPSTDKGNSVGRPEMFNQGDKQPELKIPLKNTPVRGQNPMLPGPADYQEYKDLPTAGGSSVPLNRVLPSYQKSAEKAINKQNIPPAERKRVKKYFESLQGTEKK